MASSHSGKGWHGIHRFLAEVMPVMVQFKAQCCLSSKN